MCTKTMTAKTLVMCKKNLTQDYIKFVIKQNIFTGGEKITVIIREQIYTSRNVQQKEQTSRLLHAIICISLIKAVIV
jgi:hypothetical protein